MDDEQDDALGAYTGDDDDDGEAGLGLGVLDEPLRRVWDLPLLELQGWDGEPLNADDDGCPLVDVWTVASKRTADGRMSPGPGDFLGRMRGDRISEAGVLRKFGAGRYWVQLKNKRGQVVRAQRFGVGRVAEPTPMHSSALSGVANNAGVGVSALDAVREERDRLLARNDRLEAEVRKLQGELHEQRLQGLEAQLKMLQSAPRGPAASEATSHVDALRVLLKERRERDALVEELLQDVRSRAETAETPEEKADLLETVVGSLGKLNEGVSAAKTLLPMLLAD